MLGPSYTLPDLRPFRAIQNRMRLQGGAVVTEHGAVASDDFVTGVSGWCVYGNGDVEFNSGVFRGDIAAASFKASSVLRESYDFEVDAESWVADNGSTAVSRTTTSPITGTGSLLVDVTGASPAEAKSPTVTVTPGLIYYVELMTDGDPDDVSEGTSVTLVFRDSGGVETVSGWTASGRLAGSGPFGLAYYAEAPADAATVEIATTAIFNGFDYRLDDVALYEGGALTGALVDTRADAAAPGVVLDTEVQIYDAYHLSSGPARFYGDTVVASVASPFGGLGLILAAAGNGFYLLDDSGTAREVIQADALHAFVTSLYLGSDSDHSGLDVLGEWQAWTPSYTNLTIGNGSVTARYMLLGKTCFVRWYLLWGTTTSITAASNPTVSLPFQADNAGSQVLGLHMLDNASKEYPGSCRIDASATTFKMFHADDTVGATGNIDNTVPFTWTTNDRMIVNGVYETI